MSGNTCNQGLQCADDVQKCVTVASSGTGGDSSGTGGSSGTGTGGSVSTGGSSATGGGSGGMGGHATGGAGGSNGSGGSGNGTGGVSGPNLVTNGDLSQGDTGWGIGQGSPMSSGVSITSGEYCAKIDSSSGTVLIGWGSATVSANLMAGVSYSFSYQASTTSSLGSFDVHIGSAVPVPQGSNTYPVDEDYGSDMPGNNNLASVTHLFTLSGNGDAQAGVAFIFSATTGNPTVCIDNVVITPN